MVILKIQCPDCGGTFKQPMGESLPNFCPLCGSSQNLDPDFVPDRLNIGTNRGKAGDRTYREIEEASKVRAEMAGDPSLKITDMNDNLREGDVAAKVQQPSQEYQRQVAELGAKAEFLPNVQGLAGLARQGPGVRDGAYALAAIQGGSPGPSIPSVPVIPGAGFGGGFAPPG